MGNLDTAEALTLRWAEVCSDRSLHDLPYKIELNAWGKIEMSPASYRHALLQAAVTVELARRLPGGRVLTECPVMTEIGVRVPDAAWASDTFVRINGESTPCPTAPEICVEVRSAANTDAEISAKTKAYLAAGAHEVWVIDESGAIRYFDSAGEKQASKFVISISLPPRP